MENFKPAIIIEGRESMQKHNIKSNPSPLTEIVDQML